MKVSGKPLADRILKQTLALIEQNKLHPVLKIILASTESAPRLYIRHKTLRAQEVGITIELHEYSPEQQTKAYQDILSANQDPHIHGIIVQQPMYPHWSADALIQAVSPAKDVDGFVTDSNFTPATALGVWTMLEEFSRIENYPNVESFLAEQNITVLGKGRTAGKPIRELLSQRGFSSQLIDSRTPNPQQIIRESTLVISATGRKNILNGSNIRPGCYVIGIGVSQESDDQGKVRTVGDIYEPEVAQIAKLYCPTIGGIGPLTIAHLLYNTTISALATRV
jgi:methylenetetrahydrofolate dehydrogenase (NADP+)/methenyltetrahydrofolate cyclohydrolase